MKWVLVLLGLALATQIWLAFRVGRSNVGLALVTFFLGSIGALFTLVKHRNEEETTITVPFFVHLVLTVLFLGAVWWVVLPALEAQEREFYQPTTQLAPPAKAASAAPAPIVAASQSQAASAAASAPVAMVDPVDALSKALTAAGLNHVVTRVTDASKLPAGVTSAALYSVVPVGSASAASAAAGYSVTLFVCESAAACRSLAGAQMRQSGGRMLQNELLLLATPPVVANDTDLTPTAVASTFRKL